MSAHYFIGMKAPAAVRPIAEAYQNQLGLSSLYKVLPYEEDLHMTLLFIGSLADSLIEPLTEMLSSLSSQHKKFALEINHLSYFGLSKGPRVVYLGVEHSDALVSLQQDIYHHCHDLLSRSEENRFTPHITIAKKLKPMTGKPIAKETFEGVPFEAGGFSLYTIHPDQSPKYEEIGYFKLSM
ncbi:RNA 2',3'-cyclic phosphodiesterase [Sporosarcina sp. Te-1]|uniref:RNA 2',3'-cyclic phosphodiesterase n=1 Tax=Sporosarcina sp. Te-1 TaxID=2818390 RepID=UPI001A9FEB28|nr:RNA 2',3'-cyclic phosphodiesterase [Sporosarcina sp. Te-1]QTD41275.1 RNA 2',3'-cyclic phosphodiesterase [Sporosarcina sp. Te-1]